MATHLQLVKHGYLQLSDDDKIQLRKEIEEYEMADSLNKSFISLYNTIAVSGLDVETKSNGPMSTQASSNCPCCGK